VLRSTILSKYVKQDYNKKTSSSFKQDSQTPIAWYCASFQKNKCSKASPHKTVIRGVEREVNNFCATCYRMDKIKSQNPECSSAILKTFYGKQSAPLNVKRKLYKLY
jgi:hypothetical protein